MNIINPEAVGAFCDALAARAATKPLATWLRRNLRNHVLRDPALHVPVDPRGIDALVDDGTLTEAPSWLPGAVARGDALALFVPDAPPALSLAREVGRMIDHRNAVDDDEDLSRMSVEAALAAAGAWERTESRRRLEEFARANGIPIRTATALLARDSEEVGNLWRERDGDCRDVAATPEGCVLKQLLTVAALRRESALMDHCVETYAEAVVSGRTRILSLRDASNMPLATIEIGEVSRSGRMRVVARFLPRDLVVAVQVRGIRNAKPTKEAVDALASALAAAGIMASETEWAWLGLPPGLRAMSALRVSEMAQAMPEILRAETIGGTRLSSAAAHALSVLLRDLDALAQEDAAAIATGLAPDPDAPLAHEETLSVEPVAEAVTWTVPNLLLTGHMARLMARAGDGARPPLVALAGRIVEGVRARPLAVHSVVPALGTWRDPLPFFAWCGLAREWTQAVEDSVTRRRRWLDGERHRIKLRLRAGALPDEERSRLVNAVNVQIPRLLATCARA